MIYRGNKERIKEYEQNPSLNQSALKYILNRGMQIFLGSKSATKFVEDDELYYEEKKHFIIGKAVDTLLTMGDEAFNEQFHVSSMMKKLGPKVMSVVKRTFDIVSDSIQNSELILPIEHYKDIIHRACNEENYLMNRAKSSCDSDSRVVSLVAPESDASKYWQELRDANDKQVISQEEKDIINTVERSFINHPNTADYFKNGSIDGDIDVIYQMPIYWRYGGVDLKSLPDMIIVNHAEKTIQVLDIKTLGNHILNFNKAIKVRRYDIQASFYLEAVRTKDNLAWISDIAGIDVGDYTLLPFQFLVESTLYPGYPMVFQLTDELIEIGRIGQVGMEYNNPLLGWTDAISQYRKWEEAGFTMQGMFDSYKGKLEVASDFDYLIELNF